MPRRKVSLGRIADARERARTVARRKEGLLKAAADLSKLCGVQVAVAVSGGGGGAVWESHPGVVLARYRALPAAERARHTHAAYAAAEGRREAARLARARRAGPRALDLDAAAAEPGPEAALLASVDAALCAAEERARALGVPDGAGPFAAGEAEDMDAWIEELMWDGAELLLLARDDGATPSASSSTAGGDVEVGNDQQYPMEIPGVGGGDHGNGHQYPSIDSYNVSMNGLQSNGNAHGGLPNTLIQSCNALVPVGHSSFNMSGSGSGNFAGAPAIGTSTNSMVVDANGYAYQKQCLAGDHHYQYFTGMTTGFQMHAPRGNAVVPVGNPTMDVAVGGSFYAPAAGGDFVTGAAPAVGTGCHNFVGENGYEYETQCLLDGHDDLQYPDATGHCFGLEHLNYFSDVAEGFVF